MSRFTAFGALAFLLPASLGLYSEAPHQPAEQPVAPAVMSVAPAPAPVPFGDRARRVYAPAPAVAAPALPAEPAFSTHIFPDLEFGIDDCLPDDERCRAFVAGDGPKKGRFVAVYADGSEVEISRFRAWRELRCLAVVAWAEARSEGPEGMLAVMQLVRNRAEADGHPDTICAVIAKKGQFEAMMKKSSRRWLKAARDPDQMVPAFSPKLTGPDAKAAESALVLAWRLMTGQIDEDPTGGATFFATIDLIEKKGSGVIAPNLVATAVAGRHVFFRPLDDLEEAEKLLIADRR